MDVDLFWLVLSLLIVVVLFYFLRGRGGVRRRPEMVQLVLTDVKMDQALVQTFYIQEKPRQFERG